MARYALVIGIAKYNSPSLPDLSKTATDADAIAQILERDGKYRVTLINQEVSGLQLAHQLEQFLTEQASHNEALIYFTGHGIKGITGADYLEQSKVYLAASDCKVIKANDQWTIREGGVSLSSLNKLIQKSILSNLIVILDACHSGEFLEQDLNNAFNAFNSRKDYFLITACRRDEKALAKKSENHSVFSGALLAGLKIEQAWENGQITAGRLFDFIYFQLKNSPQEPFYLGGGRSIALVTYQQPQETENIIDTTCPYQGLRYFTEKQAKFFFGRKKIVETLKQKLEQSAFVPLIGASGSGKSSIVRAGLIPWLKEEGWQILDVILPGDEPLNELKRVFTQLVPRTEISKIRSLIETSGLSSALKYISGSGRLLLVVDQFEEVFSFCSNDEDRAKFIQLLTEISEIIDSRLAIVTTMRADFLENCLQYSPLYELIQNQAVFLSPLLGQDLKDAIVKPTRLQGYSFDEGLLEIILRDVESEKGCLPLLEFTLTELWKLATQENYRLTVAQYKQIGGLKGSLSRRSEEIYQDISTHYNLEEQQWVKRILLKLVRTGEDLKDTRQRRLKKKLLSLANDEKNKKIINDILDKLVYERLLTADKEGWIDLSHEALMESWGKFAEWRQFDRELRKIVDRIEDTYKEWQQDSRDENLIMGGLLEKVDKHFSELKFYLDAETKIFCTQSLDKIYYREITKEKLEDLFSSFGFALRSFSHINQFLELSPLMAARVTDCIGGALVLYKGNKANLEQIHCQDNKMGLETQRAFEKAIQQIDRSTVEQELGKKTSSPLSKIIDEQLGAFGVGSGIQFFGTPLLVKMMEQGRLYVFSNESEYIWTPARRKLTQLVADQTAVAIANNELTTELRSKENQDRELEIASEIQLGLLPSKCPQIQGIEIAAKCITANRLGGDYYDFIPVNYDQSCQRKIDDKHQTSLVTWSIVIGNVMGKGLPAGLIMTMTRGMLRAEVCNHNTPAQIMQNLNRLMYTDLENSHRFVSIFYSEYNPQTKILSFTNAAHNPSLLWHSATNSLEKLDSWGMLIGSNMESEYEDAQVQLVSGDIVLYYTKGFTNVDNGNGDLFDEDKLCVVFQWACLHLESTQEILDYLFEEVAKFATSSNNLNNDMTSIVIKVKQ